MSDTVFYDNETKKQEGWRILADTTKSLRERRAALLNVIDAHYERSVAAWNGRKEHGSWPQFVCSWLWANGERVTEQDVITDLRKDFPLIGSSGIAHGRSYWGTGTAKPRKR